MVEVGGNQAVKLGAVQKLVMTYFSTKRLAKKIFKSLKTVNPTARFQPKPGLNIEPFQSGQDWSIAI